MKLVNFSRWGILGCVCAGLVTLLTTLIFDELLAFKILGVEGRGIGDECHDGLRGGETAQEICILDDRVVKVPRACIDSQDVFACKWRLWKQQYTNRHWDASYAKLPFVTKVLSFDGTSIEMERAQHHRDVEPQKLANKFRLQELDIWLRENAHIMLDVNPHKNVFLDEQGGIVFVDFNLAPAWTRNLVERFENLDHRLEPFHNIYGRFSMFDWVAR